ncbi:MAG TPA: deoxyribose-phosphate aldolase [Gammaproteobacteria bacterium]|jgi:deoxyribose-phosphate aldolase|nr:deoxyribose-phosphate aldolase [Gammaproteobacteria bacterium]
MPLIETAHHVLALLDLTRLDVSDSPEQMRQFCQTAMTDYGPVAAVCIDPECVAVASEVLAGQPVNIASVANFPQGWPDPERAKKEIMQIARDGGDEVDVVFPWRNALDGDLNAGADLVSGCKSRCGNQITLKVILETGELQDAALIYRASRVALDAGADFIKTSTGKRDQGATLSAAEAMLRAIADHGDGGIKISGGVKTVAEADAYLSVIRQTLGADWISAKTVRIGASGLLNDVMTVLHQGE